MRYIVRTIRAGERIPLAEIESKRRTLKEKILAAGWQYVETEGQLGAHNALGIRIEEKVYLIETVSEVSFI